MQRNATHRRLQLKCRIASNDSRRPMFTSRFVTECFDLMVEVIIAHIAHRAIIIYHALFITNDASKSHSHQILPRARRGEAKTEAKNKRDRDRSRGNMLELSGSAVWLWAGKNLVWRPFLCRGCRTESKHRNYSRPKGGLRYARSCISGVGGLPYRQSHLFTV
jgi:hypothetical protein